MPSGGTVEARREPGERFGRLRARAPPSAYAWGAVAVVALFVALTLWWTGQDHGIPYGDDAEHLRHLLAYDNRWRTEGPLGLLTAHNLYPPGAFLVGILGLHLGSFETHAPVVAENLVFVPLLALGVYWTGRLWRGPAAGLLAVIFALGAPLIVEQFHVFMLDAPQTALVALVVALILASDRFRRVLPAAAAGLVIGFGAISKETMPLYLVGLLAVVLARGGGWRNWRGIGAFALVAALVGGPWYLRHLGQLHEILALGGGGGEVPKLARPPLLSGANLTWYGWATLNGLLFAPLFLFALAGVTRETVGVARERSSRGLAPELLGGLLGGWLVVTVMSHHDLRYTMPLIVFLATLGTGWILDLPARARAVVAAGLVLAVAATTLGATFGVGGHIPARLLGNRKAPLGEGVPPTDRVIVYQNHDFLVSRPRRGGDVLAMMRAMRREGVVGVLWSGPEAPLSDAYFNPVGLGVLAVLAELQMPQEEVDLARLPNTFAVLIHTESVGTSPPCLSLADATGVWVRLGNPEAPRALNYCPFAEPKLYP